MNFLLEIMFVALVLADTVLTYAILESGKGVEIAFARRYINNPAATAAITLLAVGALLFWLNFVHMIWMLIPAILRMAWLVRKNWRILHG
jgi:hypothetical protein